MFRTLSIALGAVALVTAVAPALTSTVASAPQHSHDVVYTPVSHDCVFTMAADMDEQTCLEFVEKNGSSKPLQCLNVMTGTVLAH